MSEVRSVTISDASGKKSGSAELPADLFDVTTNIPLIHQVVVAQQAAARQGTHSTKTRAEVSGGGKKPWRQKGTGRARQGSRRAPQWTGGGIVHGPTPRNYAQRTPKKMIIAALRGALSDRARDERVFVISELLTGDAPATAAAAAALSAALGVEQLESKVLVVLQRDQDLEFLSLRNLPTVHTLAVDQLNAYDVLWADQVVFSTAALAEYVAGRPTSDAASTGAEPADAEAAELAEPKADSDSKSDDPARAKSLRGKGQAAKTETVAGAETAPDAEAVSDTKSVPAAKSAPTEAEEDAE